MVAGGRRDAPANDVSRRESIALVKPGESIVVAGTCDEVMDVVRGFPNLANKTFANWTFANGESHEVSLAKV
jgi:hypothetical protein